MDHRVLSEKALARLKEILARPASYYGTDAPDSPDPYSVVLDWAQDPEYGGLPRYSARPFADWLSNCWDNWTDDEDVTVEQVLQGAVMDWCGGRVMPS